MASSQYTPELCGMTVNRTTFFGSSAARKHFCFQIVLGSTRSVSKKKAEEYVINIPALIDSDTKFFVLKTCPIQNIAKEGFDFALIFREQKYLVMEGLAKRSVVCVHMPISKALSISETKKELDNIITNLNRHWNTETANYPDIVLQTPKTSRHLGHTLDHFVYLYSKLSPIAREKTGLCIDTSAITRPLDCYIGELDTYIGIKIIRLFQLNDKKSVKEFVPRPGPNRKTSKTASISATTTVGKRPQVPETVSLGKGVLFTELSFYDRLRTVREQLSRINSVPKTSAVCLIKSLSQKYNIPVILERSYFNNSEDRGYKEAVSDLELYRNLPYYANPILPYVVMADHFIIESLIRGPLLAFSDKVKHSASQLNKEFIKELVDSIHANSLLEPVMDSAEFLLIKSLFPHSYIHDRAVVIETYIFGHVTQKLSRCFRDSKHSSLENSRQYWIVENISTNKKIVILIKNKTD